MLLNNLPTLNYVRQEMRTRCGWWSSLTNPLQELSGIDIQVTPKSEFTPRSSTTVHKPLSSCTIKHSGFPSVSSSLAKVPSVSVKKGWLKVSGKEHGCVLMKNVKLKCYDGPEKQHKYQVIRLAFTYLKSDVLPLSAKE